MQEILVILSVGIALWYLGRMFYKLYVAKETKCTTCAAYQIYKARA
jgi:hypothetical protein